MQAVISDVSGKDRMQVVVLATVGLAGLLVSALVLLTWMLLSGLSMRGNLIQDQAMLERYTEASKVIESNLELNQSISEIKNKLHLLNQVQPQGIQLEEVFGRLESAHIHGVIVQSLSYDRQKNVARLKVVAQQTENVFAWIDFLSGAGEKQGAWVVNLESSEVDDNGEKVYLVHVQGG